jgi:hypothetical protein
LKSITTAAQSAKRNLNWARAIGIGLIILWSPWSIGKNSFGGGTAAAESAHYRFRTKLVYLPRRIARIKKSSTHDRVRLVAAGPAALCAAFRRSRGSMCAAQYLSRSLMKSRNQGTASHAPTTLVLETWPPGFLDRRHQFCSDLQNKISEPRSSVSSVISDGG